MSILCFFKKICASLLKREIFMTQKIKFILVIFLLFPTLGYAKKKKSRKIAGTVTDRVISNSVEVMDVDGREKAVYVRIVMERKFESYNNMSKLSFAEEMAFLKELGDRVYTECLSQRSKPHDPAGISRPDIINADVKIIGFNMLKGSILEKCIVR